MYTREGISVNENGHLMMAGCDLVETAEKFGTPLYVYDGEYLRGQCARFQNAMANCAPGGHVAYAGKAFLTTAVAVMLKKQGMWLDCVSEGEIMTAVRAGFPCEHIIFHGSNKSDDELALAVRLSVGRVVLDSVEEAQRLSTICVLQGKEMQVLLRVNPGVDAHTHSYIQTARVDCKFGVGAEEAADALLTIKKLPGLKLMGVHTHLGSQIFNPDAFEKGCERIGELLDELPEDFAIEEVNLGGGFSVRYTDADVPLAPEEGVARLANALRAETQKRNRPMPVMLIEPGRAIAAESCVELYSVGAVKEIPNVRLYASVDGGLADNPRPALYQAEYACTLANRANAAADTHVRVAGRSCETDTLIEDTLLPRPKRGDILAVFTSGAYQYSMAGNYNKVPIPAVALADHGRCDLIVKRQTIEQLLANDVVPEWI